MSIAEQLLTLGFEKAVVEYAAKKGDSFEACYDICIEITESGSFDGSESSVVAGRCKACTYDNNPGVDFCEICGTPLEMPPSVPSKPSPPSFVKSPIKQNPAPQKRRLPPLGPDPPMDWVDSKVIKANPNWRDACIFLYRRLLRPEEEVIPTATTSIEYKLIPVKNIGRIFNQYVKDFDKIRDRLNTMPALRLIEMTYDNGIPQLNQSALVIHSRDCLRYIMCLAAADPTLHWKRYLTRIAEAFSACQAEQARTLDAVYGELVGRDKGLIHQVDAIVSNKKHVLLEIICQNLNPMCKTPGASPSEQIPHLMNAYIKHVGTELGIKGVAAAGNDRCAKNLADSEVRRILADFRRAFSIIELAKDLINDINQQSKDSDRLVDPATLMAWAGDENVNNGFPSHKIFYDDTEPKGSYGDDPKDNTKPTTENMYSPFLSNTAGIMVLYYLYLEK